MAQGQIEQRGPGTYRIRWFQGRDAAGKRRYGSLTVRGTKRDAQRALRNVLTKGDKGLATPSPSRIPTLERFVEAWKNGPAAASLRERTKRDYLENLKRHVLPGLGHLRLDSIRTSAIEEVVVEPLRQKGHLRAARLAVCALSRVFKSAVKDPTLGLVGNPCFGVEVGRKARGPVSPLTAAERKAFRKAIGGTEHEQLWLLMMLTGLGPGEALALGWEHIDFDTGTLRVARTLDCKTRRLVEDAKRPSRLRTVPLVPELGLALRERWLGAGRPSSGLLFHGLDGRPLDLDNLRARHFKPALKAAKITRPVRIYALRHGFATAGLEAGLSPREVADLMGHSSTRTTQDVYQHVSDQRKRAAASEIAKRLG